MTLAITLHLLAAVIWVGGMFFAYMALRPVAASLLEPPVRLTLWAQVFARFFPWVWISVVALLATGYWVVFTIFAGFGNTGLYIHIMHGLGIVMVLLYLHVFFNLYQRGLVKAVAAQDWPTGGRYLGRIRHVIAVNLSLGLITIIVATAGRYL